MERYPEPARPIVASMTTAAAANGARATAFQGAPGANSHAALAQALPDALPLPCWSFEDAIDAVREGLAARALIPIENSLHGRVADIHFLLPESGLTIVGEHFMPIRHALLGSGTLDDVRQALSHPQALGQCRRWLRARGLEPISYADTAAAAARVRELADPAIAALAPPLAAEIYGLRLLVEDASDAADNVTRFLILAREPERSSPDATLLTTLVFAVRNVPAALYKAMGGFATNGVNMTKLESYQRGASFTATEFYADIVGHPDTPAVARALEELRFHSHWVRLLGTYPSARSRG